MIQSMTGYGSYEEQGIKVEIRSVNNKFLEINLRGAKYFLKYEPNFRNLLKQHFSRGFFEVTLNLSSGQFNELHIDDRCVANIVATLKKIKNDHNLSGEIDINTVLSFKDALMTQDIKVDESLLMEVFKHAMDDLLTMRLKEGLHLKEEMLKYIGICKAIVQDIIVTNAGVSSGLKDKLCLRMKELIGDINIDQTRLLQEAALLSDKADISEELTRTNSHLEQFTHSLQQGGKIGRKLDFILQELNREANTITSKTSEYKISALAVELKNEIEKLREQSQNIQ
jgi:uncharacterized protein (TIGR00255 family)